MGEDSIRYDFFYALQKTKALDPWQIQLEYPVHNSSFIPRHTVGSKRLEKPQIDLWVDEPQLKMCVEFGMFRRNSNLKGDIAVTENTIKMLNDFIRLSLHSHCTGAQAYFVCVADEKMLNYQLRKHPELPAFPGEEYNLNYTTISQLCDVYKSSNKFDLRFVNKKKELMMHVKAELIYKDSLVSQVNLLKTYVLVWKVSSFLNIT